MARGRFCRGAVSKLYHELGCPSAPEEIGVENSECRVLNIDDDGSDDGRHRYRME